MTAEEVRTRSQLIRQVLGPVFGRLQSEFLNPFIRRCFGLAYRAGELGPAPQSLSQFNFVPDYRSPLARAQKYDEVEAMDKFEARIGQASQLKPDLLDIYDADKAYFKRAELLGLPVDLIREQKDVDLIRKNRDQQAALQAQNQQQALAQAQVDKSNQAGGDQ
jgi:hypothetical protein